MSDSSYQNQALRRKTKDVLDERDIPPHILNPSSDLQQKFSTVSVQGFQAQNNMDFIPINSGISPASANENIPYPYHHDIGGGYPSAHLASSNDGTVDNSFAPDSSSTLSAGSPAFYPSSPYAVSGSAFRDTSSPTYPASVSFQIVPQPGSSDAQYFSTANISTTAVPSAYESDYRSDLKISGGVNDVAEANYYSTRKNSGFSVLLSPGTEAPIACIATLNSNRNMEVVPEKPARRKRNSRGPRSPKKNIPCDFHKQQKKRCDPKQCLQNKTHQKQPAHSTQAKIFQESSTPEQASEELTIGDHFDLDEGIEATEPATNFCACGECRQCINSKPRQKYPFETTTSKVFVHPDGEHDLSCNPQHGKDKKARSDEEENEKEPGPEPEPAPQPAPEVSLTQRYQARECSTGNGWSPYQILPRYIPVPSAADMILIEDDDGKTPNYHLVAGVPSLDETIEGFPRDTVSNNNNGDDSGGRNGRPFDRNDYGDWGDKPGEGGDDEMGPFGANNSAAWGGYPKPGGGYYALPVSELEENMAKLTLDFVY